MAQTGNGVSTTVYGASEATSTFGSSQHNLATASRSAQDDAAQRTEVAVEGPPSATPPSPSSTPQLPLTNPHLTHLEQLSVPGSTPSLAGLHGASSQPLPPSSLPQSSFLSSRGGASNLLQSYSASQSSLGHSAVASGPRGRGSGGQRTSQDSLEQQIAALTLNMNNSNNIDTSRIVDVYIEP